MWNKNENYKQPNRTKRGKTPATKSRLVQVLNLFGSESEAGFFRP